MADTSLIIGNGNWAVKETSLLGYNIIQSKYVPIEMTVSRNTTATRVNSAGLIELVPRNLLNYSEQFNNVYWTQTNVTVTANTTAAPNNTMTADTVLANGTTNTHSVRTDLISFTAGTSYSLSVFVKKGTNDFVQLFVGSGIGGMFANFNINTGVVGTVGKTSGTDPTSSITNFGNGWYRCTMNFTATLTNDTVGRFAIVASASAAREETNTLTTSLILWGAQLETGTTATEYFPTTDRFNIPRVDYSTGTASLLVEPARTNVILQSETFDNASWNKNASGINTSIGTSGIESNVANAPSGTLTADRVNFIPQIDLDLGLNQLYASAVATQSFVSSIYVKGEGSNIGKQIRLRIKRSLGGSYVAVDTTITLTSDWVRITSSALTLLALNTGVQYIISSNDATNALIWGAQLEQGSTATSYIPTTTIALARNADVISKTGISSLIGQTEGTMYVDFNFTQNVNTNRLIAIGDGTTNNRAIILLTANTIQVFIRNVSGTQYSVSSSTILTGRYKVAVRYKQNDFGFYINGVPINTSNSGNLPINLNNFYLATSEFGATATEIQSINSAQLYKTALDNDQCIDLTN